MLNAEKIYHIMTEKYGTPRWWSDDPFTVMFQAVLVQNTSWGSVEKTCGQIRRQIGGEITPGYIDRLPVETLEELIRPCGFFKAKARTIKALTAWFSRYHFDRGRAGNVSGERLREELLSIRGVGAETADVILVYAFYKPFFIVDAYTRRLLKRLGYTFSDDSAIKEFFGAGLSRDARAYGYCHWLILDHCISTCRKRPECGGCCFRQECISISNKFSLDN